MQGCPFLFLDRLSFWWNWSLKIIKQFANDDNTVALPAVCGKNMQRKYHEMRLIFSPSISQPQGIFSCNFFYWSACVHWDLIFKTVKLCVVFFNYDSPCQDYLNPQDPTQIRFDTTSDHQKTSMKNRLQLVQTAPPWIGSTKASDKKK